MFVAHVNANNYFEARTGGMKPCEGNYAPTGLDWRLGNPGVYKHCAPLELGSGGGWMGSTGAAPRSA